MRIKQLIKSINIEVVEALEDFEVRGISCDSKSVNKDFVFVAIEGARRDGRKFIEEAIAKGARAIVVQESKNTKSGGHNVTRSQGHTGVLFIATKDARSALAQLAKTFYKDPSAQLKVIGVTGTNGKTTITYLIEAILHAAKFAPAVIGTINYRFKGCVFSAKNGGFLARFSARQNRRD
jgi:UDP-N-acetylmuramoyl-L-alanyl-D-glutamate--2,6-diaminopimelate ligase